jgi:multidrug resistance efflux pump
MGTVKAGVLGGGAAVLAVVVLAAALLRPHEATARRGTAAPPPETSNVQASDAPIQNSKSKTQNPTGPITLLGTLLPGAQASLSVRQPSRIVAVLVKEGQPVRKGQLLAQFDTSDVLPQQRSAQVGVRAAETQVDRARAGRQAQLVKAEVDITNAQAGVMQARAKLRQAQLGVQAAQASDHDDLAAAQSGVHKAELALQNAQKQLHSLEELNTVGGVARNDLEGARTQVEVARTDLANAQAGVQRVQEGPNGQNSPSFRVANAQQEAEQAQAGVEQAKAGLTSARRARTLILAVTQVDIRGANVSVEQARVGLAGAQIGEQSMRLVSPLDGVASGVTARVGETAQPGTSLVNVVSTEGARVEALVAARLLPRLHVGQSARIVLDTQPDQPLTAVLSSIARVAELDGRTFRVTFRLTGPLRALRVGQNARISLL